jgi:Spy/CpxP family protein refolding chaperone
MNRFILIVTGGLLLLAAGAVSAQPPAVPVDPPPQAPCRMFAQVGDEDTSEVPGRARRWQRQHMMEAESRRRQHLEQFRLLKLLELLDLKEDQEVEFITAYRAMRRDEKDVLEQHRKILDEIGQGVESGEFQSKDYTTRIDQVLKLENQRRAIEDRFVQRCREFLTPEQVAKFLVFRFRFEQELLKSLGRFGGRGPMSGGGEPGMEVP